MIIRFGLKVALKLKHVTHNLKKIDTKWTIYYYYYYYFTTTTTLLLSKFLLA